MTEDEARDWIARRFDVPRETAERLEQYVAILLDEMTRQNLIAESTRDHVWARHIVDSAQLLPLAPPPKTGRDIWVDLGAGAGLPGIVIAILSGWRVTMIEMRRKRIDFLQSVIHRLGLANADVIAGKVEGAALGMSQGRDGDGEFGADRSDSSSTTADRPVRSPPAAVISARAYAPLEKLIPSALHLTDFSTIWMLPKGQNYKNELAIAQALWHYQLKVEHSLTAPDSAILQLRNVRPREGRKKAARGSGNP